MPSVVFRGRDADAQSEVRLFMDKGASRKMGLRDYLAECFTYDEETGNLIWKTRPRSHFRGGAGWHNFNRQFAGKVAGCVKPDGRREVKLDGKTHKSARLIWVMHYDAVPDVIDHINGDPSDDRLSNLRASTPALNARNRAHQSHNSSGFVGVTLHKQTGRWWARVTYEGRTISLGLHADLETAKCAVLTAKSQLFGGVVRAQT